MVSEVISSEKSVFSNEISAYLSTSSFYFVLYHLTIS